jgi:hypothetical protein
MNASPSWEHRNDLAEMGAWAKANRAGNISKTEARWSHYPETTRVPLDD